MPIKDLSERLRFPRIGKIRLGIKTKNEKGIEYPKSVDYFACDHPAFQKVYPGQPKTIDICFPVENEELFASQFYRAYSRTRGLVCKGDGETCSRMIDADTGNVEMVDAKVKNTAWAELPCIGRECGYYQSKACREIMFLQFLLPRVEGLGIWQLDTSSINSIININSSVMLIKSVIGHVAMLPLKLSVAMIEVSPEGRKKHVPTLQIEIPLTLGELRGHNMLPEPEDETPEELFPTEEQKAAEQEAEKREEPKLEPVPQEKPQETPKAKSQEDELGKKTKEDRVEEILKKKAISLVVGLGVDARPKEAMMALNGFCKREMDGLLWKDLTIEGMQTCIGKLEDIRKDRQAVPAGRQAAKAEEEKAKPADLPGQTGPEKQEDIFM